MATARPEVSIPHAHLRGAWNVLTETDEGRPTVAVRDDERSGVAISYPFSEGGNGAVPVDQVAVVVNVSQKYVLLAASFDSLDAIDWLLASKRISLNTLPRSSYDGLSSSQVCDLLSEDTVVVVDRDDDGTHGALQLHGGVDPVRSTWIRRFPRLDNRLFTVGRILTGMDLDELSRRVGSTVNYPPN